MNLQKLEAALLDIFGQNHVNTCPGGFRVIVYYDNLPYCIVIKLENNKLSIEQDEVDKNEKNYEEAYKKAYKMLILNKDIFDYEIVI